MRSSCRRETKSAATRTNAATLSAAKFCGRRRTILVKMYVLLLLVADEVMRVLEALLSVYRRRCYATRRRRCCGSRFWNARCR